MSAYWTRAPEVEEIAGRLIPALHPHLEEAAIQYIFRHGAELHAHGAEAMAVARRCTGLLEYFSRADFIIEVSSDWWESLSDEQRVALVDHELCHCIEGKKGWEIRPHDIEEFAEIVDRHGLWRSDLRAFIEAGLGAIEREYLVGED